MTESRNVLVVDTKKRFRKSLAAYYLKWFRDCYDSADYCIAHGDSERAIQYLKFAKGYFDIINDNWDAIQFFTVGDNAFLRDSAIPEEFRGYE